MNQQPTTPNPFDSILSGLNDIKIQIAELESKVNSSNKKRFVSVREFAQQHGIAEITIYRNASKGLLNTKRIGSRLLIETE
jgi:predicted DNA-binding transcriptional regulator AlpA